MGIYFSSGSKNILRVKDLTYSDTYWDDLRVAITSTKLGGSKDPQFAKFKDNGAGSQGVFTYWFDATAEEEVYFAVQIPHSYKYGTDLHPHVHWAPDRNGGAGEVVSWGLEYCFAEIGEVYGNSNILYGNTHVPADASLVGFKHYLTEIGTISGSSIDSVSSMIICRLFRNATGAGSSTDSFGYDTALLEFDIHFEIDSPGSKTEYAK